MFVRPNGKSRPPSGSGHGHAHGGKRRFHKAAVDASQLSEFPAPPVPVGEDQRPTMKKKLELPAVSAVVPDKAAVVDKVGPRAETEGVVSAVEATEVAEGLGSTGEASAACSADSGPAAPVYKKPAFLAKK
jgi:hypothetical protein